MLHYYLKLAYRTLLKTRISSLVNILGLCFGFTCAFYIAVWVKNELGYDRFHHQAENIYMVGMKHRSDAEFKANAPFPWPYAERYKTYPEIEQSSKISPLERAGIVTRNGTFEADGLAATLSFFDVFHFPFLEGSVDGYGDSTKVIFLTERFAERLFDSPDIIGKTIDLQYGSASASTYVIGGVLKNPPANSSIQFEFVVPWSSRTRSESNFQFWSNGGFDFVRLHPQTDINELNKKLLGIDVQMGDMKIWADPENPYQASVFPFTSIYLDSSFSQFKHGNMSYIWIVGLIGLAIVMLTVVNHINLTSSQVALRNKELSVRKLIGSGNKDFMIQFIIESVLFIVVSLALTTIVVKLFAGSFFQLVGQEIDLSALFSGSTPFVLAAAFAMIAIVSGLVLAAYFNHSKPVDLLKGNAAGNFKLSAFKEKLMIFQITVAITGLVITFGLNMQLHLMMDKDPGFDKENIVKVDLEGSNFRSLSREEKKARREYINNKLSSVSFIMDFDQGNFPTETSLVSWQMEPGKPETTIPLISSGKNFFTMFGLTMLQGKPLSESQEYVVLNETAVRQFHLKDPIGHTINHAAWGPMEVIGVVKDFNFEIAGAQIKPLVIFYVPNDEFIIKIAPGKTKEALAFLQELHSEVKPGTEFSYTFFDEEFDKIYKRDIILSKMMNVAALLAVTIAILGLFSLVLIFAKEKTKEIGIRKVMGAQVSEIITMIGYHFFKRMLIAFAIAVPLSYFALHKWLENFAYKITLSWWLFAVAGLCVFVLAFLTIALQAFKSAHANPVESLRNE